MAEYLIESEGVGERIDKFVSRKEGISREFAKKLIESGHITLNGERTKPSRKLRRGDIVSVTIPPPEPTELKPEEIPIRVLYQDDHLIVVDKPPGMPVHPGAGVRSGTLVNALLSLFPDLPGIGGVERPGIVHRLDKDTSGVMVVAKSDLAHQSLIEQFKSRKVEKRYLALICGVPKPRKFTIDMPIGRSIGDRKKFSVNAVNPKEAVTEVEVLEELAGGRYSLVEARPKTGRTHQIRVHLSHIGYPIVGDPVYGGGRRRAIKEAPTREIKEAMERVERQMLHARLLGFRHPATGEWMEFEAPMPRDMLDLLNLLRKS
ncbi:RluA family pseudouridine synthase [Candidatus Poribacteria bacterium]|nr:MAG: RluA family pseudouridine synthase [Candidatus Poribacteria bacterium]